jgi:hydrogenase maturation protease
MELWKGERTVFVIDAVSSNVKPGTIHRFDAAWQPPQKRIFQNSTHAFGLHEAMQLAQCLHQLPSRLIIYGIEGESFAIGKRLSAKVKNAVPYLIDCILAEAELEFWISDLCDKEPQAG